MRATSPATTAVTAAMHASFAAIRRSVGANHAGIGVRIARVHAFTRVIDDILASSGSIAARITVITRMFAPDLAVWDVAGIVATVVVARGVAGLDAPDVPILNANFGRDAADLATETTDLATKTADVAIHDAETAIHASDVTCIPALAAGDRQNRRPIDFLRCPSSSSLRQPSPRRAT